MNVYVISSLLTANLVLRVFATEKAAREYIADEHPEYSEDGILSEVFHAEDGAEAIHIVECEVE